MVNEVIEARMEFLRRGAYPADSASAALGAVYQNPAIMKHYMLGLALSYFLWRHHQQLLNFFRDSLLACQPQGWALEVGCGHGLFLAELLDLAPGLQGLDVVDLSPTSIDMARSLVQCLGPAYADRIHFFLQDLYQWQSPRRYAFITLGEVLEHVEDPGSMLRALGRLLEPGGRLYITTCANCPAIDHVYHFKTVEDIRAVARGAGYRIVSELVAPSEERSEAELARFQIDISYAAVLALEA
jgi:2-polyprenyl-3-methyl-5-hydroxy-6-metoxy-1,4-benzoquinol methylase